VVFNNAGIMQFDDAASTIDENLLTSTIAMNLFGPIRLTPANHSGLMPQALTVLVARGGRWRLLG